MGVRDGSDPSSLEAQSRILPLDDQTHEWSCSLESNQEPLVYQTSALNQIAPEQDGHSRGIQTPINAFAERSLVFRASSEWSDRLGSNQRTSPYERDALNRLSYYPVVHLSGFEPDPQPSQSCVRFRYTTDAWSEMKDSNLHRLLGRQPCCRYINLAKPGTRGGI